MSIEVKKMKKIMQVGQVFSPGAPINQYSLFAGRFELVKDVVRGINQRGQHVILYGERGVGKTSLANVLKEIMEGSITAIKVNCDTIDNYKSIWLKILRDIVLLKKTKGPGFLQEETTSTISLDNFIDENKEIHPEDIRYLLDLCTVRLAIIIDEIDRISDEQTKSLMADTIKTLSDHSSTPTLILVGVADSVEGLIKEHLSIERALIQVRMPRMSITELEEILDKGYKILKITITDEAKKRIVKLSQGLPHYTHLLGLHSAESAIDNDRTEINEDDVDEAVKRAIYKAQQTIISTYNRAITSPRKTLFSQVLLSCALAKKDILGTFTASDVRQPMSLIMDEKYEIPAFARHLNDFCEPKRGSVLQKLGSARRFRYRFANPMLEPYSILHGLATGIISKEKLATITE